ncbi:MAG: hypothetical protein O3C65_15590, partial [Proteobacteria bacterium]|nr:hypothetical protein [Pseudomonadota bacterium]
MLGVSGVAMMTGGARADCSPAGDPTAQLITCDDLGADNSLFDADDGADIINIISGIYAQEISGGAGDD